MPVIGRFRDLVPLNPSRSIRWPDTNVYPLSDIDAARSPEVARCSEFPIAIDLFAFSYLVTFVLWLGARARATFVHKAETWQRLTAFSDEPRDGGVAERSTIFSRRSATLRSPGTSTPGKPSGSWPESISAGRISWYLHLKDGSYVPFPIGCDRIPSISGRKISVIVCTHPTGQDRCDLCLANLEKRPDLFAPISQELDA